jgi:hypothetical protein
MEPKTAQQSLRMLRYLKICGTMSLLVEFTHCSVLKITAQSVGEKRLIHGLRQKSNVNKHGVWYDGKNYSKYLNLKTGTNSVPDT